MKHRADSYGRLAFLGDSVLGLAIAEHLFNRFPRSDIGRLTKVHGQAVSGRACADVADELGLPGMLQAAVPEHVDGGIDVDALLACERALSSVCEAVIGACYLHHGYEATAAATVAAFAEQMDIASEQLLDFKSALQEALAARRLARNLRRRERGRAAARSRLRGDGEGERRRHRPGRRPQQEGRRAGRCG